MRLVRATLKATVTADGLCELKDGLRLGSVYYVDLDGIQMCSWGHMDRATEEVRESIFIDSAENGTGKGWMPTELLDIPGRGAAA